MRLREVNSLAQSQRSVWESWDSTQVGVSPHPAQGLTILGPKPLKQCLTRDAVDHIKEGGAKRSVWLMLGGWVREDFAEQELTEQF